MFQMYVRDGDKLSEVAHVKYDGHQPDFISKELTLTPMGTPWEMRQSCLYHCHRSLGGYRNWPFQTGPWLGSCGRKQLKSTMNSQFVHIPDLKEYTDSIIALNVSDIYLEKEIMVQKHLEDDPNIVLRIGKIGLGLYNVDFKRPMSPAMAFCIALCNLEPNLDKWQCYHYIVQSRN